MTIIFVGEDRDYVKHKTYSFLAKSYPEIDPSSFIKFSYPTNSLKEVCNEALAYSFFDENKTIIYEDCAFLTSTKNKLASEEEERLKEIIELSQSNKVIMTCSPKILSSIVKEVKNKLVINIIDSPTEEEFTYYVNQKAKEKKIDIDRPAVLELIKRSKDSKGLILFGLLENNINKLFNFSKKIRLADVELLINIPLEDNIFKITQELLKSNPILAIKSYRELLNLGYQALTIPPILMNSFNFYARVKYLKEKGYNDEQIKVTLKENNIYRIKYSIKDTGRLSYKNILKILNDLAIIEDDIKFKLLDASTLLEQFFLNFSKYFTY